MSWHGMYNADRRSQEFMDGVHSLLRAAEANKHDGFTCCPCAICKNTMEYPNSKLFIHTCSSRFHAKLYLLNEAWKNRSCNGRR
jgi:hypothetical protein